MITARNNSTSNHVHGLDVQKPYYVVLWINENNLNY